MALPFTAFNYKVNHDHFWCKTSQVIYLANSLSFSHAPETYSVQISKYVRNSSSECVSWDNHVDDQYHDFYLNDNKGKRS